MADITYYIQRQGLGGILPCACGQVDCQTTDYAERADRAYAWYGNCSSLGHTAPIQVSLEQAQEARKEDW